MNIMARYHLVPWSKTEKMKCLSSMRLPFFERVQKMTAWDKSEACPPRNKMEKFRKACVKKHAANCCPRSAQNGSNLLLQRERGLSFLSLCFTALSQREAKLLSLSDLEKIRCTDLGGGGGFLHLLRRNQGRALIRPPPSFLTIRYVRNSP